MPGSLHQNDSKAKRMSSDDNSDSDAIRPVGSGLSDSASVTSTIPYVRGDEESASDAGSMQSDLGRVPTNKSILYVDPEMVPPIFRNKLQEFLCVAMCTFAPAAASMSSSSFQVALDATQEHFHVQGGTLTWCINSVILANGSCLLLMGGVADALGRRYSMLFAYTMFALFSLISGFMDNFIVLCIMRGFMGAAVACATPASAGFLGSTYKDSRRKNMVMSMFSLGAPVGGASGFFIAGVCLQILNWRSIQWFFTIVYGLFAVIVYFVMPADETRLNFKHARKVLGGLDYFGSLLSLASITLIVFSLTQVDSVPKGWHTGYIIALMVVGIVLLPAFVLWEIYGTKNPIMPMSLYRHKTFDMSMIIACLDYMAFNGTLTYFAVMYFEVIRGYSPIITACCMLPMPIVGCLVNIIAGLTMHKIKGSYMLIVGTLGFVIGSILWATMDINRNYFCGPFFAFIFTVIGADNVYNVCNRVTMSLVAKKLQSRASGTFNTIIQLSASIGLGISSAVVTSKYPAYGTTAQNNDTAALFHGIKYAYYVSVAMTAVAFIVSWFVHLGVLGAKPAATEKGEDLPSQDEASKSTEVSEIAEKV